MFISVKHWLLALIQKLVHNQITPVPIVGMHNQPLEKVKKYKKLLLNDGDFMNKLKLIELLTILQLTTIQNSSNGNNIKPQAIKRLVISTQNRFFILHSQKFSSYNIMLSSTFCWL